MSRERLVHLFCLLARHEKTPGPLKAIQGFFDE